MSASSDDFAGSDAQYHASASTVLDGIEAQIDRWLDEDVVDIDTARTGSLLELSFSDGSKIVVNMQPPLHELWLAARTGGFHFRRVAGVWRDTKNSSEFGAALSSCVSEHAGKRLAFALPPG